MNGPIAIVLGTRPEIIKLSPVIKEIISQRLPFVFIHTNQHYSEELDSIFFKELNLPQPHHNLNVGPGSQTEQTARMMTGIAAVFESANPSCLIVQGDTNSVLAGALAASKMNIPIAHVEAGLRSDDRSMPEEINRIVTDHVSSLLFPPTQPCADNLAKEGIPAEKIKLVGNTVVDSVLQNRDLVKDFPLEQFNVTPKGYYLLTLHRPSNVDSAETLAAVIALVDALSKESGLPVLFPAHPRTASALERFGISLPQSIAIHPPVSYREFLALQTNANTILTDSGGIQEEACILGIPCITLRDSTERPETVEAGANVIVHHDVDKALQALAFFSDGHGWKNPFGDGTSSKGIVEALKKRYGK